MEFVETDVEVPDVFVKVVTLGVFVEELKEVPLVNVTDVPERDVVDEEIEFCEKVMGELWGEIVVEFIEELLSGFMQDLVGFNTSIFGSG